MSLLVRVRQSESAGQTFKESLKKLLNFCFYLSSEEPLTNPNLANLTNTLTLTDPN